jgi:3-methylcrotonyl-CoA carboxylase alpha subunit
VRVDAGVESGDSVPIHYDPMIAKIIVYDRTRAEAIRRMDAALRETVILGTTSNLDFLGALVNHPAFAAGDIDTGFIERHLSELIPPEPTLPEEVLVALTLDALNAQGGMNGISETIHAANDPWSRADSFRIGEEK